VQAALTDPRILEQLRSRGFRNTGPRRAVVAAAARRRGRFTASDILEDVRPQRVGRATVFRTLDLLADLGILERLHSDSHHAYTLCSPEHHHHLVCTGCARVEEIVSPAAERVVRAIAQRAGFRVEGHLLEIVGLCQRCQQDVPVP
jgi:Fe2+ or Zn2+ uptake regulation protein